MSGILNNLVDAVSDEAVDRSTDLQKWMKGMLIFTAVTGIFTAIGTLLTLRKPR